MADVVWGDAKYLVLHFSQGKLESTKVCATWRGAQMSKRNHLCLHKYGEYSATTRIIPIDAILAIKGLEKPDTELSVEDVKILQEMGISV